MGRYGKRKGTYLFDPDIKLPGSLLRFAALGTDGVAGRHGPLLPRNSSAPPVDCHPPARAARSPWLESTRGQDRSVGYTLDESYLGIRQADSLLTDAMK